MVVGLSNKVKVVEQVKKAELSKWGICEVTITPQVLEELRQGKTLFINVMNEYSVCISVGKEVSYEED